MCVKLLGDSSFQGLFVRQAIGNWGTLLFPHVQTHCSHGEGRGFRKPYYAWWVSKKTHRLSSKLAHGLKRSGGLGGHKTQCSHGWFQKKIMCCQACTSRGLGGRSSLICKHTARMVNGGGPQKDSYYACWVSNSKLICSQASLPLSHARRSPPPRLQKHCSHGEWGFKNAWRVSNNDSCAVTQA